MDTTATILAAANDLYVRATPEDPKHKTSDKPPIFKAIGISLAIASGVFIGTSFVLKKMGLLKANVKYNEEAGEGYGYLKNAWWWTGMTLMIVGEICNFVAYAFVDAILVTPLGALSVVITTILSAIFLKERLSFVGKVGCFNCIIGSVVIVLNAPEQSAVNRIEDMKRFVITPGFLSYAGVIIVGCAFVALWAGPRYGKKSMLVYLSICSLIGGLSVVATQGLGSAILAQARGTPQFNQWFIYVLIVFVLTTLVTEIIYLNKALNIFNAALVTPTYYVFFTSATIVTSAVLFQGFKGTPMSITTVVMGFLQICSGVILLQLSKSAKDVPDAAIFKGDLDQVRTVAEQEQPESEPKADAIRGTAMLVRRFSQSRQKMEEEEARRVQQERRAAMESIGEDEQYEWDGLRRRRTQYGGVGPMSQTGSLSRRKTLHPPLGLTHFPEDEPADTQQQYHNDNQHGMDGSIVGSIRRVSAKVWPLSAGSQRTSPGAPPPEMRSPMHPVALTDISAYKSEDTSYHARSAPTLHVDSGVDSDSHHRPTHLSPNDGPHLRWADSQTQLASAPSHSPSSLGPTPPPHSARRQFSFQNVFHRHNKDNSSAAEPDPRPSPGRSTSRSRVPSWNSRGLRSSSGGHGSIGAGSGGSKGATEEERLGLVKGDSTYGLATPEYVSDPDDEDEADDPHSHHHQWTAEPDELPAPHTRYVVGSSSTSEKPLEAVPRMRSLSDEWRESREARQLPPGSTSPESKGKKKGSGSRSPPRGAPGPDRGGAGGAFI